MSLFKTILSKIFAQPSPAAAAPTPPRSISQAPATGESAGAAAGAAFGSSSDFSRIPSTPNLPVTTQAVAPTHAVDVAAIMDHLAASNPENLEWKRSIVDLMKLLDMDSSLASRKELADELNYNGNTNDSAKMNVWLHQQVLKKVAENGGKFPASLLV